MMVFDTTDFSGETKARWHPRIAKRMNSQRVIDMGNARFAPNLEYELYRKPKVHYEHTPLGRLTLDRRIASGRYSSIFTVEENPNVVVKYQSNCGRLYSPHPALLDYWGLQDSAIANIEGVPRVFFISPGVRMPREKTTKCDFGASEQEWRTCNGSTVRFTVMEKVGVALGQIHFVSGRGFPPRLAVRYGVQLISILREMHLAGIIHGDVHAGNVLLDNHNRLKLTDFDQFKYVHPLGMIDRVVAPFSRSHPFLSPWEIQGYAADVRDDLFRAVAMVATLMHPRLPYEDILLGMSPEEMHTWKTRGMLFSPFVTPDEQGDSWGVSDPIILKRLRELFEEVLRVARSPSVQIPLNHDHLIAQLRRIEWILSR